jgi:transposase
VAQGETARKQFNQRWKYHRVSAEVTPVTKHTHPGRPSAGAEADVVGYALTGSVEAFAAGVEEARRSLGKFILATNEMDDQNLSAVAMLETYTAQGISVERGFRFLKDPLFFADSLFLKNPARIMALIMIMGLALLVFALGERQLRLVLKQNNQVIPDQKRKPTQNPTLHWVFQMFEGLDVLSVVVDGCMTTHKILNLRPVHLQIINLLGPQVMQCYMLQT